MKFSTLKSSVLLQFSQENGHLVVPFITGQPGGGKSACAREIAKELQTKFNIPDERVVEFNPSLRDPVDIMGVPFKSEDGTHSEWLPPQEFYTIRAGQGPSILILEEMSDAGMAMQNPLCRVILDRYAGQMKLSEQLFIIATGNRVEDKSGANRLSTKLGNRVRTLEFESNVEDWMDWAYTHGIKSIVTSFIKFRPALLSNFDPKVAVNPTPRSWEDVNRIPTELDAATFYEHAKGAIGEGAATEFAAFIKVAKEMPDPQEVLKDPKKAPVPTKPDVLYAFLGAVESLIDKKTAKNIVAYGARLSPEFQTILMIGCYKRYKDLISVPGFTDWAVANAKLLA
ncbi:ATP-binding protein [Parasutterella excrementihominis]